MTRPFQVLSKFREGLDTEEISKLFGIPEAEVCDLLHEARATKPDFDLREITPDVRKRAVRKALFAQRSKKPVTLASVSFLKTNGGTQ